jgi:hypothetical protein
VHGDKRRKQLRVRQSGQKSRPGRALVDHLAEQLQQQQLAEVVERDLAATALSRGLDHQEAGDGLHRRRRFQRELHPFRQRRDQGVGRPAEIDPDRSQHFLAPIRRHRRMRLENQRLQASCPPDQDKIGRLGRDLLCGDIEGREEA